VMLINRARKFAAARVIAFVVLAVVILGGCARNSVLRPEGNDEREAVRQACELGRQWNAKPASEKTDTRNMMTFYREYHGKGDSAQVAWSLIFDGLTHPETFKLLEGLCVQADVTHEKY
jgi:hypothetical protein